jgi:hypothetical protein
MRRSAGSRVYLDPRALQLLRLEAEPEIQRARQEVMRDQKEELIEHILEGLAAC